MIFFLSKNIFKHCSKKISICFLLPPKKGESYIVAATYGRHHRYHLIPKHHFTNKKYIAYSKKCWLETTLLKLVIELVFNKKVFMINMYCVFDGKHI